MLSIRKLQKCAKEPKLHEVKTCIKPQKGGSKSSQGTGGSSVAKFCFAGYEISQPAKFTGCEFSQPCKISIDLFFSLVFLVLVSSGSIMNLQIRLGFIVFESD